MSFFTSLVRNKNLAMSILSVSLILIIGQWLQADLYFDRSNIHAGQWWKIISGNFTHSNTPHLLLNLTGLWILGLLFIDTLKSTTFILSTLFLAQRCDDDSLASIRFDTAKLHMALSVLICVSLMLIV